MPRISKVRIVNFTYNDGKRMIADELFDFTSSDGQNALNVLVNLENGGGKSVLVQLMMQPVLPKAKVANRNIASFFNKPSDHCFIVLEWLKDQSTEKLLTGIAMAAREASSGEDDFARGMSVKYYTFYTNYAKEDSPYSIVNLPLSSKENGRFVAAEFQAVRTLARNSKGMLCYYTSDDSVQWQRKLAEYGLVRDEWKMIEDLNTVEGGLENYFGKYKTSDALVNGLLIPTIERKLRSSQSAGDDSLSTMLLSYANQYAVHESVLKEKEVYEKFAHALEQMKPQAEELWTTNDQLTQTIKQGFGLSDSLAAKISELSQAQKEDAEQQKVLEEKRRHVKWEEASLHYYQAKEEFHSAEINRQAAETKVQEKKRRKAEAEQQIKALECANYAQKLHRVESEIQGYREEIYRREHHAETGNELSDIRYSIACAVQTELDTQESEWNALDHRERETAEAIKAQSLLVMEQQKKCSTAKTVCDRLDGKLSAAKKETDRQVELLHADLFRKLDGFYTVEEIDQIQYSKEKEATGNAAHLDQTVEKIQKTEKKLAEIPEKQAALTVERNSLDQQLIHIKENVQVYQELEGKILAAFDQYNLDRSLRFTNRLKQFLTEEQRKNEAKYADTLRRIEVSEEALVAAKRGSLHVPHAAIEYLNATGVPYTTCEKYLLDAVQSQRLSKERCLEILRHAPAAAYGVVMDAGAIQDFFDYGREEWLPSMIPLFQYEQMEKILQGEEQFSTAIAFYSETYFADREGYVAHLQQARAQNESWKDRLLHQKKQLEEQLRLAEQFSYSPSWHEEQTQLLMELEARKCAISEKAEKFEKRKAELASQRNALSQQLEQLKTQRAEIQHSLQTLSEVSQRMREEENLLNQIHQNKMELAEAERNCSAAKFGLDALQEEEHAIKGRMKELLEIVNELKQVKMEVSDGAQGTRVEGSWRELYHRYQALQKAMDTALLGLKQTLQQAIQRQREYQAEIDKRKLPEDMYRDLLYSAERERELRTLQEQLEQEVSVCSEAEKVAISKHGIAKAYFENAETELRPYGQPLEPGDVGTNFEKRLEELASQQQQSREHEQKCGEEEKKVERVQYQLETVLDTYQRPAQVLAVTLEDDYLQQCEKARNALDLWKRRLRMVRATVSHSLSQLAVQFSQSKCGVMDAVMGMTDLFQNELRGDRYYTLTMHIEGHLENTKRAIGKIETDLEDFEQQRTDLIYHCTLQGQRVYDGLKQLQASSRVQVHEGVARKQMLRFDIPDTVEPAVANAAVTAEIDQGVKEIVDCMRDPAVTEAHLKKKVEHIVGSETLLRKYIGKESIQVEAYKIDQSAQNSRYRTWEKTQVNNSGAEKFVIYFAVILALIHFTRGNMNGIQDRELHSALILDNPFGSTTSKHILAPMFAIAKHFRVQLICLSHITQMDVLNCFDMVIKAIIKKQILSSNELLTHEGNEEIEHGFYRTEQMSLL